jgi:hypothetical protein
MARVTYDKARIVLAICSRHIEAETSRGEDGTITVEGVKHWKSNAEREVRLAYPEFDRLPFDEILKRMHAAVARKAWRTTFGKKVTQ